MAIKLKKFLGAAAAAAGLTAMMATGASAEADVVTVTVDNTAVVFDQNPVIIDGRTLVPVRAVFEQAGAVVDWNQDTQTATIARGDYTVTIKYGDNALYKNGERVELEVASTMINNRILIPVRAIAEAMDFAVTWDGHHSMVLVSTTGKPYRPYAFLKTGFRTLDDAAEFFSNGAALETGIDLDGDGMTETIEFTSAQDLSSITAPVLKINDVDYTANLGSVMSVYSMAVVDLDSSDNKKEIVISENGNTLTARFYRYENGILKAISNENGVCEISYASRLLVSGTGYIISDLNGACFVDIMVTGGVYKLETDKLTLYRMRSIESIFGRNLYKTYDDNMLYHIIYTNNYTQGAYREITDTGVVNSSDLEHFKIIDGYMDPKNPTYIELFVELSDGTKAVIKPYQV